MRTNLQLFGQAILNNNAKLQEITNLFIGIKTRCGCAVTIGFAGVTSYEHAFETYEADHDYIQDIADELGIDSKELCLVSNVHSTSRASAQEIGQRLADGLNAKGESISA